ncbi:MAG: TRAP transporter permease, partial [Spirochaetales bacterium]|nr:TRAP transporter permease [Spirochaetales bacterium]
MKIQNTLNKINEMFTKKSQSPKRNLTGLDRKCVFMLTLIMAIYHIYALFIGLFIPQVHNAWHLLFIISLIFLIYKGSLKSDDKIPVYDFAFSILSIVVFFYVIINYNEIIERAVLPNNIDVLMGLVAIFLTLEACRRSLGNILPLIALLSFAYIIFGKYMPGVLFYRGASIQKFIFIEYMQTNGLFGSITKASSTLVYMFITFGAFLLISGGGKTVIDLAYGLAGRFSGGPAKVAIIASSLFGSISGSAVANTVTTGQFTIPLMKEVGYPPAFAGAVEAAASTGGLIMPPIMGAGAFVMAEILGIPYWSVVKAAIIPACLYYGCVFTIVHLEALKLNLVGIEASKLPNIIKTIKSGFHNIIAIFLLIIMLFLYIPIVRAALYCIIAIIVLSIFAKPAFRMHPKNIIKALIEGGINVLPVAAACATANVIVGVLELTGGALKISDFILNIAGQNLFLILIFTMIILIVLGMGLPAVAAYVIGAAVAAPIIINLGVPMISGHLFIFYFSNLCHITPPIALSAYAAAGIAQANPMETSIKAWFLGSAAFIVPFMFVYNDALLLVGNFGDIIFAVMSALLGVCCLGLGISGFMLKKLNGIERIILIFSSLSLIKPGLTTDIIGVLLLIFIYFIQ